jgi:hypothetical protein
MLIVKYNYAKTGRKNRHFKKNNPVIIFYRRINMLEVKMQLTVKCRTALCYRVKQRIKIPSKYLKTAN